VVDATEGFFAKLAQRGHEPVLEKVSGTVRFDLATGEHFDHWLVTIDKGDLSVSRDDVEADCVARLDRAVFDEIVTGRVHAMAALLRGEAAVEGQSELIVRIQRLMPDAPNRGGRPRPSPTLVRGSHGR
jgi:putative sterol carrier protein